MQITVYGAGLPDGGPAASLECDPGETVLEALTRGGIRIPSACRAGVCRACLVKVLDGDPGAAAALLEKDLRADGYFLACQARPSADITMSLAGGVVFVPARLLSVRQAGAGVLRVRVRPDRPLAFRAGQHIALRIAPADGVLDGDGALGGDVARAYSIANLPHEAQRDGLEFHVRLHPGGAMSGWLAAARPGTVISLGRPSGRCCYDPAEPGAALLLAGTGTGLAPLAAFVRDALAQSHAGPIIVLRGGADAHALYPDERLRGPGVRTRTCLRSRGDDLVAAVLDEYARLAQPQAARAYLCGSPGLVIRMRKGLFLAGLSVRRIHCDEFIPAVIPAAGG
jgi:CDP-4-dehydro-6-deoxyglucose reductase